MSCSQPLIDGFDRRISYLRLSVTDRCDLRCAYCMPEAMQFLPKKYVLSLEEMHKLGLAFIDRGITRIRLTGGEPLVRRDVMDLVRALGHRLGAGLEELTLTTNGTQLEKFAPELYAAGVRRVNVSLDTLDARLFAQLSRRDRLAQVLRGIAAASEAGLQVKINTVALKGLNEAELPEIVRWAHGEGHDMTLIEVMPLGEVDGEAVGLVKLSGDLVRIDQGATGELGIEGLSIRLTAAEDAAALDSVGSTLVEATMKLEVDAGLSAGYRGFYSCGG